MKDERKAFIWYERLVSNSSVMKLYILNRSEKNWYKSWDKLKALSHIKKFSKMFRAKKFSLDVIREYLVKPNGKLRPLGSPIPSTKMLYNSILIFLEKIIIMDLGKYQHGFVPGRGAVTAGTKVIEYLNKGYHPYEFDLKGFFNNVNPEIVLSRIERKLGKELAEWMRYINWYTVPKGEWEPNDGELKKVYHNEDDKRCNAWEKSGFTQGAPWSPILCVYALAKSGMDKLEDLIMYADDGIVFRKDKSSEPKIERPSWGIVLARDKPHGWVEKRFKFLGITYDLIDWTLSYGDKSASISGSQEEVMNILKYSKYRSDKLTGNESIDILEKREECRYEGKTMKIGKDIYAWMVKGDSLAWRERIEKGYDPIFNNDTNEWGWTDMRTFTTNLWQSMMEEMGTKGFSKKRRHRKTVQPSTEIRRVMESNDPWIETPQGIIQRPSAWSSESEEYWIESMEFTEELNKLAVKKERKEIETEESKEEWWNIIKQKYVKNLEYWRGWP